jgi:DNA-binding NarL/FixJ family response regulator
MTDSTNIRVAIFEDNKLVRDAYEAILNGTAGFICTGSFSSCNDLEHDMNRSRPDVVLMDIEMTGMKGVQATKIIIKKYPHVKILIQTVFDDDDRVFSAICAGASGYILKSTSPARILESIMEVNAGGAPLSPGVAHKVLHLFQHFAPIKNEEQENLYQLSKREKEILTMMTEGKNLHTIAEKTFITYETVRTHVRNIYKKLHVASSSEAIVVALKQRLI